MAVDRLPGVESYTIREIMASPNLYKLTGSRRFGTDTPASDWDFYILKTPEVLEELKKWGFSWDRTEVTNHYLENVYSHETEKIHIQVIEYSAIMEERDLVHQAIDSEFYSLEDRKTLFEGSKLHAKAMWRTFMQIASIQSGKRSDLEYGKTLAERKIELFLEANPEQVPVFESISQKAEKEAEDNTIDKLFKMGLISSPPNKDNPCKTCRLFVDGEDYTYCGDTGDKINPDDIQPCWESNIK